MECHVPAVRCEAPFRDRQADLQALIGDQVPEGLFVEYKRDWSSKKVARAVASFANSQGGGWLIIGVEANKLLPTKIVALQDRGDLEERLSKRSGRPLPPSPRSCLAPSRSILVWRASLYRSSRARSRRTF
jgi:hypothetical protein